MRNKRSWCLALGLGIGLAVVLPPEAPATQLKPELLRMIGPRANRPGPRSDLIEKGRQLFFEETFDGNGRTCGTCHPATNNFTLDVEFIRKLPKRDPLFVAEFNPKLKNLENSKLLRSKALILENVDGFDLPGVMRSVPHTLGLRTSMNGNLPPVDAIGWSADGAPGTGSLREFSFGAIVQHATKSLDRVAGVDFRVPTDFELDALEAFMLTLGQQSEIDLAALPFKEEVVRTGRDLFNGVGVNRSCAGCHNNAGANTAGGANINANTGTNAVETKGAPPDGGFGFQHQDGIPGFGDGTMNTPQLIAAADTGPFFHNNSAKTLEDAIAFYTKPVPFGLSPAGAAGVFELNTEQINAIGALLRVLNAMENIRFSNVVAEQAQRLVLRQRANERINEATADTNDAIEVLTKGPIKLYPEAVEKLQEAAKLEKQALGTTLRVRRNALLGQAMRLKEESSALMVN